MTKYNTITTTTTNNEIETLARKAAAGTLKRIYDASGNDRIRKLRYELQADFRQLDSGLYSDHPISEAYDCFTVAYEYLFGQYAQGNNKDTEITVTLKNGKEKIRTVYQWACVAVRRYVYQNKALDTNGKYVYIEDMSAENETGTEALDREYIRMGKYDGIDTFADYKQYSEILSGLNLKANQKAVVKMRMRGMSVISIAEKLGVSHQAISKALAMVQDRVKEKYPEAVRFYKKGRSSTKNK